ncbi:MAG: hypothetical protein E3J25_11145 [Anaerolineales bacterium]|nr:MAG: hypothetical protein E3J25_11145 [Anaerolineales bacterium]
MSKAERRETLEDVLSAHGYVHAQDRFWRIEFWRRIGSGMLTSWKRHVTGRMSEWLCRRVLVPCTGYLACTDARRPAPPHYGVPASAGFKAK